MKEKFKRYLKILLNKWAEFIEIIVVAWAIYGMWRVVDIQNFVKDSPGNIGVIYAAAADKGINFFWLPLLFYFLSAVLILYLLRRYGRKNK